METYEDYRVKHEQRKKFAYIGHVIMQCFYVFYFYGMIVSVPVFFLGFHNADLASNVRWINAEYRLDLQEMEPEMTPIYQYSLGMTMMICAFLVGIFSTGAFFASRSWLDESRKRWGFE